MTEPLADQIVHNIKQSAELYYRLTLVVGPTGVGKTSALVDVQARTGASLLNVNLELSRLMLDLTGRQRALQLSRLLQDLVRKSEGDIILLDNTEILFDAGLQQNPLRLLKKLSRNKRVVAAWNGGIVKGLLTYAAPAHPEYRRYPIRDFLVASPLSTA